MTRITNKQAKEMGLIDSPAVNADPIPTPEVYETGMTDLAARNAEIYALKQQGITQAQLACQYGLSPEWIRRICEDHERRSRRSERIASGKIEKEDTDLYLLLVEKNAFIAPSGCASEMPLQAYHCVCRKWHQDGNDGYPTLEYYRRMTEEEIKAIPGVGKVIEAFIGRVKEDVLP